MGVTASTGPTINTGPLLGRVDVPDNSPEYGPDISYMGSVVADPRWPISSANTTPGSIRGHQDVAYFLMTNAIPSASAATAVNIAAAANVVSGTAMTLVAAASAGITLAVPFYPMTTATLAGLVIPVQSQTLATSALTIDMGFTTLNCTSGTAAVTPVAGQIANNVFYPGQWLVIGNVGNAGGTIPLVTQVASVGTTTITLVNAPLATNATAPVSNGNVLYPGPVPAASTTVGYYPYIGNAGVAAPLNALDSVSRGIAITGVASGTGGTFTVKGWDIYGMPMTETITVGAGAVSGYGKKAFKHIASVTPNFTDAHNYSVGTSDVIGFHVRSDFWEAMNIFVAAAFLSANTGWTAADTTSPATATTGDVRGTIQIGTRGPLGSGAAGGPFNGTTVRIATYISIPSTNLYGATPADAHTMYGVIQA